VSGPKKADVKKEKKLLFVKFNAHSFQIVMPFAKRALMGFIVHENE
jgi:hypothetical protein